MKRLIDATDLVKQLKACTMSNGTLINTNTMIAVIENAPTAYDAEKVVEQIEELTEGICCKALEGAYKNAIEIVRKGGAE